MLRARLGLALPLLLAAPLLLGGRPAHPGGPVALGGPVVADIEGSWGLSDKIVLLTWIDLTEDETNYEVLRGTSAAGPFNPILTINGVAGVGGRYFFQFTNLKKKTTVFLKVRTNHALGPVDTDVVTVATLNKGQNLIKSLFDKSVAFGSVPVGNTPQIGMEVDNPFPFPLDFAVTDDVAPPFSVTPGGDALEIPGDDEVNFLWGFSPTQKGKRKDTFKANVSLPLLTTPITIKLSGKGV